MGFYKIQHLLPVITDSQQGDLDPKMRQHLTLSLQVRPFRTNDTFELSKMIMRFKDQTCWIPSFLLSKNRLTRGQVI